MWKWFKMLVLLAKSLCFCQYKWQEDCYHSFYQIHPSLISFLFLKNGHAFKNSEVKNCIGPEKPKVVVSANAVRWKWATVRATWQHTPQQTKKKTSDEAEMAGGGAHVSKGCGGTGENMSLQMWHHGQTSRLLHLALLRLALKHGLLLRTFPRKSIFPNGCV